MEKPTTIMPRAPEMYPQLVSPIILEQFENLNEDGDSTPT